LSNGQPRRPQHVCQHLVEAQELCDLLIHILTPYLVERGLHLDYELLRRAVRVHDFGEGVHAPLGRDMLLGQKIDGHDKAEYDYFVAYLADNSPGLIEWQQMMCRAFLLQFCLNGNALLPQEILTDLKSNKRMEALLFNAIERWGYFIYALEQYLCFSSPIFLLDVFGRNTSHYDSLAAELPGFAEEIWTAEVRAWRLNFLSQHGQ